VLQNYDVKATASFWSKFPSRAWPVSPETDIDVEKLEAKILFQKDKMTVHQYLI